MRWMLATAMVLAPLFFGLGVVLPLVRFETLYFFNQSPSLLEVIAALWTGDDRVLAVVVALVSVAFPVVKLIAIATEVVGIEPKSGLAAGLLPQLSRWSLMDVVLVALVIVAAKTGGLAEAFSQPGLWFYGGSALLAAIAVIDSVWLPSTPISLNGRSLQTIVPLAPLVIAALLGAKRFETNDIVYVFCTGLAFILVAWPTLRLFNHLSMTTGFAWADPMLSGWDAAIGFNWHAYIAWLDGQRWLLKIMNWTYTGLNGYSLFFFGLLALSPDRRAACFEFVALFAVSATFCMALGMFFPAQAAMVYYAPDLSGFQHVHAAVGTYHIESLEMLRETPAPVLDLDRLPGLVTFPSFHTAMGVVLIYACRRSLFLLVPSLGINLSMIAATPLYGSHYGIDDFVEIKYIAMAGLDT